MFSVNVQGAIKKGGKWLIIERGIHEKHAAGILSLVGGTVEPECMGYDSLEMTVKREIFEEVGIEIKDFPRYIHSSTFMTDRGIRVLDTVFLCENEARELRFLKAPKK